MKSSHKHFWRDLLLQWLRAEADIWEYDSVKLRLVGGRLEILELIKDELEAQKEGE